MPISSGKLGPREQESMLASPTQSWRLAYTRSCLNKPYNKKWLTSLCLTLPLGSLPFFVRFPRKLYLFSTLLIIFFILSLTPSAQAFPSLSQERIYIKVNEQLLRRSDGGSCLTSFEHLLMLSLKPLLPLAPRTSPLSAFPTVPLVAACQIPLSGSYLALQP